MRESLLHNPRWMCKRPSTTSWCSMRTPSTYIVGSRAPRLSKLIHCSPVLRLAMSTRPLLVVAGIGNGSGLFESSHEKQIDTIPSIDNRYWSSNCVSLNPTCDQTNRDFGTYTL